MIGWVVTMAEWIAIAGVVGVGCMLGLCLTIVVVRWWLKEPSS